MYQFIPILYTMQYTMQFEIGIIPQQKNIAGPPLIKEPDLKRWVPRVRHGFIYLTHN